MDYLFLRRNKRSVTSERQRKLLFKAADAQWKQEFGGHEADGRKVDCDLYKKVLYTLEIRQEFLNPELSLKKLCAMIETNQTYLSNVVNKYFGCSLRDLINSYRVEYAKELLHSGKCLMEEMPMRCGFASKSAFYAAFSKNVGMTPLRYKARQQSAEPTDLIA